MPRKLRRYRAATTGIFYRKDQGVDANECFILTRLADYLTTLQENLGTQDKEFLEAGIAILGPWVREMVIDFRQIIPERLHDQLDAGMEEAEDADDVARVFLRVVAKGGIRCRKRFWNLVNEHLGLRKEELAEKVAPSTLAENIHALSKMLSLNEVEREFLTFLVVLTFSDIAENYFVNHLQCQVFSRRGLLAQVLGFSRPEIEMVFTGRLAQLGLFECDWHDLSLSTDYLKLFQNPDADSLPGMLYRKVKGPALPMDAFLVDQMDVDYLCSVLGTTSGSPNHVLLYGPPGTGKTSLSRAVSRKLGKTAYEVLHTQDNASKKRRMAIAACMNILRNNPDALVLVDEADNLLNTSRSWFDRGEVQDKGWLNRLMEEPGPGFIWIVNRTDSIEPSVMRRFAYSISFPELGPEGRRRVLDSILGHNKAKSMLTGDQKNRLARAHDVSAGAMDTAVNKAIEIGASKGKAFYQALSVSLTAHQKLLGHGVAPKLNEFEDQAYELEGLNVNGDLEGLCQQLDKWADCSFEENAPGARLLFYGPPGSGKSETARYLSKRLNRDLMVKIASDIIDPYVGMTEKYIRAAFEDASRSNAVLVFDEADTFLFPRGRAHRSWEISHTNEFLACMERFSGLLICTTNRFPDMDEASVRRFTHKLGFDYLTADGNEVFYRRLLSPLAKGKVPEAQLKALRDMTRLTPGDFAVVRDRFRFPGVAKPNHDDLVDALAEEMCAKRRNADEKEIGFQRRA